MLHMVGSLLFASGLLMAVAMIWHMIASRLDAIMEALDPAGRTTQAGMTVEHRSAREAMRASARAALSRQRQQQRAAA
ncbi:hypothetical protein [Sphingomonas sanxanigenens]|uniref:Uncharacterized protein n=1 Tax=Sphingomonas sanxanigenens DSM 19645 = NX02 TaxID=1123269 RepID=W0ABW0_9SPHN|nr:hypothetical protein [Sphingomonas sanxanigenens]AHE54561.1 hypothetical protein NX02_14380 [Sphingomonas sanxanigenens DSM 19645 = NX02]